MAQEQNKVTTGGNKPKAPTGGNKPKPPSAPGRPTGQSAKDRSKAQSRPVTGKAPGGTTKKAAGGGGKGGNTPRPGSRPAAQPKPRRMSGTMMAWGAVGLVIVVVAVLVVVKVTGNSTSSASTYTPVTAAPPSVVHDVTTIPASVYNKVGISSPTVQVTPPTVLSGQPPMSLGGKSPAILYYGAEYCPYCAAERWALTAALSRFGTWSNLKTTASSHTDVDAATNTFSYYGASISSPYITFAGIEQYSNVPTASGYTTLQNPTKEEQAILLKYTSSKYLGAGASTSGGISFPFIDIDNKVIVSGASYDPEILANQSWSQIASGLSDPTNPATQAIVATANYITAGICASTKGAPASVCTSPGVEAAAKALKLG